MKKTLIWVCFLAVLVLRVAAQKPAAPKTAPKKAVKTPAPTAFLGNAMLPSGPVRIRLFDSLVRQGVRAKDLAGNSIPVTGFEFTYAERGMFEDSVGNPMVVTDYLTEYCFGDTLSANIKAVMNSKFKPGDTVFVDRIKVKSKAGDDFAKSLRFVLRP